MTDFAAYPTADRTKLYARLAYVLEELQQVISDIGETEAAATQAYVQGFFGSSAKTVREREMEASRHALTFNVDLPKLKAARESWNVERAFIERLLNDSVRGEMD